MWEDLGEYIEKFLYKNESNNEKLNEKKYNAKEEYKYKVVEIGVGNFFKVADYLKNTNNNIEVVMIDIDSKRKDVIKDDIINPKIHIYKEAKIIYSIRPPYELQTCIEKIAIKINALLIIKPLFNEDLNIKTKMNLKNYKKAIFYQHQY
ncbi:MAG: hypothetical protein LBV42_03475 [Methanobrevibacter sp.]|jgi:uncharacterized UPF0146 family protein|nr:hypothetical protein [Methanobrevibacter sp.]